MIAEIRMTPAMYLGMLSVTRLSMFLQGYLHALWQAGEDVSILQELQQFQDYVTRRFSIRYERGWEAILSFVSGGESEGLALFWDVWDDFVSSNSA